MAIQMARRSHVSTGSPYINRKQVTTPAGATKPTTGARKGLFISGRERRSTQTPAQTRIKANRVPMLTRWPKTPIGNNPAAVATAIPVRIVVM
jgi:hypothetical protein